MLALLAILPPLLAAPGLQNPSASKPWDAMNGPQPEELLVGGDEKMRYLLHAPDKDVKEPASGWHVLVVMPGGDGSADSAPFLGGIRQNALGKEWVLVELIAPMWDGKQADEIVWPTEKLPYKGMKFSTEKFFDAVLVDLGKKRELDPKFIYTLTWGSSGPVAYALALVPGTRVTGSLVAKSVFNKDELPPLKNGAGRRFYILHSPEDKVCPFEIAEQARDELARPGAEVELRKYEGGHDWPKDLYGEIKLGIAWLASGAKPKKDGEPKPGK